MEDQHTLRRMGAAALVLVSVAGGCQSYEARPIDSAEHRAAFLARTPDSPEVAEFARALAKLGAAPETVFDPSDGLGLEEAEVVALLFNRELRLARLRAGVSGAGAKFAGLWEDPVLGTDLARIIESTEHPWKVFASVGFTIPISGRLEIEKKRAAEEHRADVVRVWAQEWATRAELKRRWVSWSSARERAAVMTSFLERLDAIVGIVDRIAGVGEMTRVEARLFRIERATRASELAALVAAAEEEELALRSLLGLPPGAAVELVPRLAGATEETPGMGADEGAGNAELLVALAEYDVAERSLELEVRRQYPDLTIGPGYGREDGQDQFLLGLSIPLPLLNRNQQSIAVARAQRELARAGYESSLEGVIAELAEARVRLRSAVAQREVFERDVVPLVDEQYAETRRIAELGEVNPLVLLETLSRQQEAKARLIDARAAESLARLRLVELTGPSTEPRGGAPTSIEEEGVRP